jgi:D-alanine-D-alanine ligase
MARSSEERIARQPVDDGSKHRGEADCLQQNIERLMTRLRIAVIFGSNKSTPGSVLYQTSNTRSWKSYEAVAQDIAASLQRIGFRHVQVMPDDMRLADRLRREQIHIAWLNTGGVQGYNSAAHASSLLEMLGVPYVGHDPLAATTLDNKHAFKREAVCAGIPTAAFSTWNMVNGPFRPELNSRFKAAFGDYAGPFIVKPVSGRASLHVHVAEDRAALPDMVETVYQATENVVLIEKYLSGREFCIGVAGPVTSRQRQLTRSGEPFTLSAIERVFNDDEKIFTSMDKRPITNARFKKLDPERDGALLQRLHRLACEIYREFNLSTLIRLDLRSDEHGNLHVLEANPKPDLKRPNESVTSLISAGLSDCGMDYDDLVFSLIADRLDYLFTHRREAVGHILDLLAPGASAAHTPASPPSVTAHVEQVAASADHLRDAMSAMAAEGPATAGADEVDAAIARINAAAAEINLLALKSSFRALSDGPGAAHEPVEGATPKAEPGNAAAA